MGHSFYFSAIVQQMNGVDVPDAALSMSSWLEPSYRHADSFWRELMNYLIANISPAYKSCAGEFYDLYHDIVVRHLDRGLPAWRWYEADGWHTITFDDLHALAMQCEAAWRQHGVKAGQTVCLVLPLCTDYVVSLVTAFKMGLVVSALPPQGPRFMEKRLKLLKPDHIATHFIYEPLLTGMEKCILPVAQADIDDGDFFTSHTAVSGSECAMLFSPLSNKPHVPRAVTCDDIYLPALRDGLLLFALRPGDHLAAPAFHPLQYQPALLIATLLAGAAYVHLGIEQIEKEPALLQDFPFKAVGVSGELRETLMRAGKDKIEAWQTWFKSACEPLAWTKWEKFCQQFALAHTPCRDIVYHALSGCLLFSPKSTKPTNLEMLPAPGLTWKLTDVNESGQESHTGLGLLATPLQEADKSPLGGILLARCQNAWLYAGTRHPTRNAHYMPRSEIAAVLADLEFAQATAFLSIPGGGESRSAHYILLVFVGDHSEEIIAAASKNWTDTIRTRIANQLSAEFLPDRIEIYPLYARLQDGAVDQRWCEVQYLTGLLHRKSKHLVYRRLTALRRLAENC